MSSQMLHIFVTTTLNPFTQMHKYATGGRGMGGHYMPRQDIKNTLIQS